MLRLLIAAALVLSSASVSAQSHPPAQKGHGTPATPAPHAPAAATPAAHAPANSTPHAPATAARSPAKPAAHAPAAAATASGAPAARGVAEKKAVPMRAQAPPRTVSRAVIPHSPSWPRYVLRWVDERWRVTWPTTEDRITLTWPQF